MTATTTAPLRLTYTSDPGHGWLAAPRALLADLGLLDQISTHSYQRGSTVYLEEDCDAGILLVALRDRAIPYTIEERHVDRTPIRYYEHFTVAGPRRALRPGDTVELAGIRYRVIDSAGPRRGWAVDRVSDGMAFRMPAAQAKRAPLVTA